MCMSRPTRPPVPHHPPSRGEARCQGWLCWHAGRGPAKPRKLPEQVQGHSKETTINHRVYHCHYSTDSWLLSLLLSFQLGLPHLKAERALPRALEHDIEAWEAPIPPHHDFRVEAQLPEPGHDPAGHPAD